MHQPAALALARHKARAARPEDIHIAARAPPDNESTSSLTGSTTSTGRPRSTTGSSTPTTNTPNPKSSTSSTSSTPNTQSVSSPAPSAASTFTSNSTSIAASTHISAASATATQAVAKGAARAGLSGGGIAAIVIVFLIVATLLGVLLVRKACVRRRLTRRKSWGAGIFPVSSTDSFTPPRDGPNTPEKTRTPQSATWSKKEMSTPMMSSMQPLIQPPAMSYNNDLPPVKPLGNSGKPAVVRCVFIPTLPDELSITTGEIVNVVNPFDDGWALCSNTRGEQGMVPLECLEMSPTPVVSQSPPAGNNSDWRNSRRVSSLWKTDDN